MRYSVGFVLVLALSGVGCVEEECAAACGDGGLVVQMEPSLESAYDVELDLDGVAGAFTCDRSDLGAWTPAHQTGSADAVSECSDFRFSMAETPAAVEISIRAQDGSWTGSAQTSPTYTPAGPRCTWPCPLGAVVTVQGTLACADDVCPCSEAGIRAAIEEGGGPFTFDCGGPQTVVTQAEIVIDNNVILDGEGNLTVDGNDDHPVLRVAMGATAELRGFTVTNGNGQADQDSGGVVVDDGGALTLTDSTVSGNVSGCCGGTISSYGTLILTNSTVSDNTGSGIWSAGTLTLTDSTVSGNTEAAQGGGGLLNSGTATLVNSTVSGNTSPGVGDDTSNASGGGILNAGTLTLVNSTVSGNSSASEGGGISNCDFVPDIAVGTLTLVNSTVSGNSAAAGGGSIFNCGEAQAEATSINSLVDGDCSGDILSNGYNIESPGDTCGFDQTGDQAGVTAEQLNLGPLADKGGPTMTHALGAGSVAIDHIPAIDCVDADGAPLTTDQRGEPRPGGTMCDVGAFEVQRILTCFQDDECSPLICCHLGSPFEPGTCETQALCNELRGGG